MKIQNLVFFNPLPVYSKCKVKVTLISCEIKTTYHSRLYLWSSDNGMSSALIPACSHIQTWHWDRPRGPDTH